MGDSITYGQYIEPTHRWTSTIDERLRTRFQDVSFETYNRGVSGGTTLMGLARFPTDVQELEPQIMTLQFGLNDCNCWDSDRGLPRVSEEAFRANLIEMIGRARRFGAREIVLSTNHRTLRLDVLPSGEVYEDANARYSDIIREVAADAGVTLCDMRSVFEPFDETTLASLLLPAPDVLHLSEEGNRVYFEAILPYIERAFAAILNEELVQ
jgi:acyl-CoA thioesterase-1